ncbi:GL18107 [Drosophila persimilis]|uniref:GL18107 n=1 Tax=Drosophila persimilis TaxID=7234 RepID=B4HC10_DROPE|nr:GL18107 [Drosophila persimilis]
MKTHREAELQGHVSQLAHGFPYTDRRGDYSSAYRQEQRMEPESAMNMTPWPCIKRCKMLSTMCKHLP